jgi:RHH-type rel operon transcriptional repressor/antitoxin RelB
MDPLLEKELELAAQRRGVTKSQFIIDAVEKALGRRDSYALMQTIKAEEERRASGPTADPKDKKAAKAFAGHEQPYETAASRKQLVDHLKRKHGVGRTR